MRSRGCEAQPGFVVVVINKMRRKSACEAGGAKRRPALVVVVINKMRRKNACEAGVAKRRPAIFFSLSLYQQKRGGETIEGSGSMFKQAASRGGGKLSRGEIDGHEQ